MAEQRQEYALASLRRADVDADPMVQIQRWLDEASAAEVDEPTAMTLATADSAGRPSARIVLLKGLDADGFVFFSNYESRKGLDLGANPHAALLFFWPVLQRQLRAQGVVERLAPQASDHYFKGRPRGSRLGAAASPQSRVIENRSWLEDRLRQTERQFEGRDVPRPEGWGGYRLRPDSVEFWQGRPNRLHDRLRYRRADDSEPGASESPLWLIERLAP